METSLGLQQCELWIQKIRNKAIINQLDCDLYEKHGH